MTTSVQRNTEDIIDDNQITYQNVNGHSNEKQTLMQSYNDPENKATQEQKEQQIQQPAQEDKKAIITIYLSMMACQLMFLSIASFMPSYQKDKHKSISSFVMGFILSTYQIASVVISPIIGWKMNSLGRKNCIVGGFFFIILATVGFGTLANVDDDQTFASIAFVLRAFQGIGDASLSIAGYSTITLLFPLKKMVYLGFCSTARGLGCMLGPVVGQMIYSGTDYNFGLTFYIFAGILNPFMLIALFLLPNSLNRKANEQQLNNSELKEVQADEYQFSYFRILTNFRAILSLLSAITILILTLFFDAIISPRFEDIGISKDIIGYLFGALALCYSLFSPLIAFAAKRVPVRYITFVSFGVATVGTFLMGPSKLFGQEQEKNKALSITGFLILGVTTASVFVPLLSEIIDAIQEKEGVYDSSQINDKASAAFNIAGSIGTIIGPILGGALNDWVQFRTTCDIFSASAAILGITYFFIGILPPLFQKKKQQAKTPLVKETPTYINPPKSPLAKALAQMEREEQLRSFTNKSRVSYYETNPQERKSIIEKALSVLGDISSRGVGGGIATNTASPIIARRELAENRLSVKSQRNIQSQYPTEDQITPAFTNTSS